VPGTEALRFGHSEIPALSVLSLVFGRPDQGDLLLARIAEMRAGTTERSLVEDVLEVLVGVTSWHHVEATRRAAIEELARTEGCALEALMGELGQVVARFDAVFSQTALSIGEAASDLATEQPATV
jgi:hypothetical protein